MSTKSMFALDRELGPGYNNSFDFSLTFESAILTIAPLGVLIAACPFHIWHYKKRPAVAKIGMHFWLLTVGLPYQTLLRTKQNSLYISDCGHRSLLLRGCQGGGLENGSWRCICHFPSGHSTLSGWRCRCLTYEHAGIPPLASLFLHK